MKNIVVIGGGLGGLTAGSLLSKKGFKVTLLEQHNIVGGCATNFKRGDFTCEVGLHEMDGVYTNPQVKKIFEELEVYKNIKFLKVPEFYKITTKNISITIPHDIKETIKILINNFPEEKNGILGYFKIIEEISKLSDKLQEMRWYHYTFFPFLFYKILKFRNKTVSEVFDKLFKNKELELILNANVQYYNDTPNSLSFLLHAIAQYSYFYGGGYFIQGGSGKLSDYLASIINKNGEVITKANVQNFNKNIITYSKKNKIHTINTDAIISNLSPKDTYRLCNIQYNELKQLSNSLLTIYMGFSKNIKNIYGKRAYSNFIYDDINDIDTFNKMTKKDIKQRGFTFVDYSQIDSKLTKTEKSFAVVCLSDYIEEWENLSKDDYKEKKKLLEESLIKKLEKYYPNISSLIEYIEVGSAKTIQKYIKTPNGTAYGYKATPKQFFKVPKSKSNKLNNLYFVGQWVIAGGFSPSINSGYLCYKEILNKYR